MPAKDRETIFSELFCECYHSLFAYIYTLVRNYTDAEDVAQQTSLVLWNKFDDYQAGTSFIGWACNVARFESLNFLKRQRRYRAHFSEAFQMRLAATVVGISTNTTNQRTLTLEDCIKNLPEDQRELLRRCFSGKETVADVSCELGRTTHSVYSSLRNIRKKLLDCIDKSVSETGMK